MIAFLLCSHNINMPRSWIARVVGQKVEALVTG
jgi:hypothetical protein